MATLISKRQVTSGRTYGYHRAEIIAAFLNGGFLWAVVAYTFYQALRRLQQPPMVESPGMLGIVVLGFLAIALSAAVLSRSGSENLNIRWRTLAS